MSIYSHAAQFAGLPVVEVDPDTGVPASLPADPSTVAWRLEAPDVESPPEDLQRLIGGLLDRVPAGAIRALVIGEWGSAFDSPPPIELLVSLADRLTGMRALLLGDMTSEDCEISWIQQDDVSPLLSAYPGLEVLRVRGGQGLELAPLRHEHLRELAFETGGLPAGVVRAVAESDLPALTSLDLWLGVEQYGRTVTIEDLGPILAGNRLPALRDLALCNADIADDVARAVASAPVVARLERLDLSKGALTDEGGEALLTGQPLTHLRRLDLHHHFLSDELVERIRAELPGVDVDTSDVQKPFESGGTTFRFTAVSE